MFGSTGLVRNSGASDSVPGAACEVADASRRPVASAEAAVVLIELISLSMIGFS
jgi:hypothetical protein